MADDVLKDRQRWVSAPYFIVDDVVSTANYYRDKLGFHYERFWKTTVVLYGQAQRRRHHVGSAGNTGAMRRISR